MVHLPDYSDSFRPLEEHKPEMMSFLDELPFWSAPFGIKLLERIIPAKNMIVLDIGYGTGFPLIELASRLGDSCKVLGIDPWIEAGDLVREKIRIYGIGNIELFNMPAENIPLRESSVDLVVSNNGLNNVEDLQKVLTECCRVLKPGGKLIFTMNTDETMMEFYQVMEKVLYDHGLTDSVKAMKSHIYQKRKPLEEVYAMLTSSGLKGIQADNDIFHYTFANGTAMLNHFFIRLAFLGPWLEVVPEIYREKVFNDIEHRINEIADGEGYFRLTVPFVVIEAEKS
jgi:arsenite methyltransferase